MKKILFLAMLGLLFAAGNAGAKAVKLGSSDDGGARIAAAKEKRVKSVKCEKGQFKDEKGECVGCTVANCAECKSAGVCKRCNAGYSLLSGGTCGCASNAVCGDKEICENKVCVGVSCPDGYYASEHKCKACSSNCLTCSDQNTCTSCEPGKYLSGGSCNGCSAKFSHCLECDSTKCTKCDGETDKINGVCVEQGCETSADCAGNQVCNASNECEECPDGYDKQGNSCVPSGSEDECSVDAECDENEKCENGGCVLKTCAEINASYKTACNENETATATGVTGSTGACYTCSDSTEPGPGPEPGGCSTDCDCQWWEVCSNKKCVTASSCTSLDACKRSKGEGGNYQNSNSGSCSVVSNKTYINVANLYCYVCPKEGNNTPKCEDGLKVGTCAYFYATCPAGWDDNGATAPGCRVCAPRGPYNGECCGDGCNLEKQELTTGNVPNGSTVWWAPDQVAYNAWVSSGHAKNHLAHATVNAKCENGKLSGVPNTTGLTCSGCYTVTCTHAFTSQTFTIGGTSSEKPCKTDSDCSDDQFCNTGKKCEGLSCGTYYCGKANHKCVLCEYCCMSDDDCAKYDIPHRKCNENHICDNRCKSNSDCVWGAYCAYGTTCQPVTRCEDVGYSSSPNSSGGGTKTNVKAGDSFITCYIL